MKTKKQYNKERGLVANENKRDFDNITANQARKILHDKKINGQPLTKEQYKLFGYLSKGHTKKYSDGGLIQYKEMEFMKKGGTMKKKKCLDGGIPTKDTNPLFGTEYKGNASDLDKVFKANPQLFKAPKMQGAGIKPSPMQSPNPTLAPIQEKSQTSMGEYINIAGAMYNMLAPVDQNRQYLRPEDLSSNNTNAYGTGSQAIAEDGITIGKNKRRKKDKRPIEEAKYSNGMEYSSFIDEDGFESNAGTLEQWYKNMFKYASKNYPESNTYRPNFQHHSVESPQQRISMFPEEPMYPLQTQPQPVAKNGGSYSGEGLQVFEGSAPQVSANPFDGGTGMFQGKSHEHGGIPAAYDGKEFEAEGDEPYRIDSEGQLEIFGNLINPITGNKFKKDVANIAKKEQKIQKISDKAVQLVNTSNPSKNKFETMKFNSGEVMLKGSMAKQKELASAKNHLSFLQNLMLTESDTAENGGIFRNGGIPKYDDGGYQGLTSKVKSELEKKYPGKKIEVKYNELGENRSYAQQSDIVKAQKDRGEDLSGLFSMHNFDEGSKDINIFIDGKMADKSLHKEYLSKYSGQFGLYTLQGKVGKKDPYHVTTVKEGQGTSADQYFKRFPDKKNSPQVINWMKEVSTLYPDMDKAPKEVSRAYKSAISAGVQAPLLSNYKTEGLTENQLTNLNGENVFPNSVSTPWTAEEQLKIETIGNKLKGTSVPEPMQFNFKQPYTTPYEPMKKEFPWEQVAPAIPQLFDTADPVLMQKYNPDLFNPYSVSFQDRRNRNTSELNGIKKAVYDNPSALGVLGAQAYSANNDVDADEFRTNQGIFNDIQNKNVSLLNEAKQKNLALTDQQYTRQTQAIGNTRDRRIEAGIQIGDVIAKNSLENKTLDVTKQLYKNYSYDKNMQLQYTGGEKGTDAMDLSADRNFLTPVKSEVTTKTGNSTTRNTFMKPNWDMPEANILNGYKNKIKQGDISKLYHKSLF